MTGNDIKLGRQGSFEGESNHKRHSRLHDEARMTRHQKRMVTLSNAASRHTRYDMRCDPWLKCTHASCVCTKRAHRNIHSSSDMRRFYHLQDRLNQMR